LKNDVQGVPSVPIRATKSNLNLPIQVGDNLAVAKLATVENQSFKI
jgi:hypothetical protein